MVHRLATKAVLVQYDPETQEPRVITYNNKALTDVERRYGQIERESLAIQYGCLSIYYLVIGNRNHIGV